MLAIDLIVLVVLQHKHLEIEIAEAQHNHQTSQTPKLLIQALHERGVPKELQSLLLVADPAVGTAEHKHLQPFLRKAAKVCYAKDLKQEKESATDAIEVELAAAYIQRNHPQLHNERVHTNDKAQHQCEQIEQEPLDPCDLVILLDAILQIPEFEADLQ